MGEQTGVLQQVADRGGDSIPVTLRLVQTASIAEDVILVPLLTELGDAVVLVAGEDVAHRALLHRRPVGDLRLVEAQIATAGETRHTGERRVERALPAGDGVAVDTGLVEQRALQAGRVVRVEDGLQRASAEDDELHRSGGHLPRGLQGDRLLRRQQGDVAVRVGHAESVPRLQLLEHGVGVAGVGDVVASVLRKEEQRLRPEQGVQIGRVGLHRPHLIEGGDGRVAESERLVLRRLQGGGALAGHLSVLALNAGRGQAVVRVARALPDGALEEDVVGPLLAGRLVGGVVEVHLDLDEARVARNDAAHALAELGQRGEADAHLAHRAAAPELVGRADGRVGEEVRLAGRAVRRLPDDTGPGEGAAVQHQQRLLRAVCRDETVGLERVVGAGEQRLARGVVESVGARLHLPRGRVLPGAAEGGHDGALPLEQSARAADLAVRSRAVDAVHRVDRLAGGGRRPVLHALQHAADRVLELLAVDGRVRLARSLPQLELLARCPEDWAVRVEDAVEQVGEAVVQEPRVAERVTAKLAGGAVDDGVEGGVLRDDRRGDARAAEAGDALRELRREDRRGGLVPELLVFLLVAAEKRDGAGRVHDARRAQLLQRLAVAELREVRLGERDRVQLLLARFHLLRVGPVDEVSTDEALEETAVAVDRRVHNPGLLLRLCDLRVGRVLRQLWRQHRRDGGVHQVAGLGVDGEVGLELGRHLTNRVLHDLLRLARRTVAGHHLDEAGHILCRLQAHALDVIGGVEHTARATRAGDAELGDELQRLERAAVLGGVRVDHREEPEVARLVVAEQHPLVDVTRVRVADEVAEAAAGEHLLPHRPGLGVDLERGREQRRAEHRPQAGVAPHLVGEHAAQRGVLVGGATAGRRALVQGVPHTNSTVPVGETQVLPGEGAHVRGGVVRVPRGEAAHQLVVARALQRGGAEGLDVLERLVELGRGPLVRHAAHEPGHRALHHAKQRVRPEDGAVLRGGLEATEERVEQGLLGGVPTLLHLVESVLDRLREGAVVLVEAQFLARVLVEAHRAPGELPHALAELRSGEGAGPAAGGTARVEPGCVPVPRELRGASDELLVHRVDEALDALALQQQLGEPREARLVVLQLQHELHEPVVRATRVALRAELVQLREERLAEVCHGRFLRRLHEHLRDPRADVQRAVRPRLDGDVHRVGGEQVHQGAGELRVLVEQRVDALAVRLAVTVDEAAGALHLRERPQRLLRVGEARLQFLAETSVTLAVPRETLIGGVEQVVHAHLVVGDGVLRAEHLVERVREVVAGALVAHVLAGALAVRLAAPLVLLLVLRDPLPHRDLRAEVEARLSHEAVQRHALEDLAPRLGGAHRVPDGELVRVLRAVRELAAGLAQGPLAEGDVAAAVLELVPLAEHVRHAQRAEQHLRRRAELAELVARDDALQDRERAARHLVAAEDVVALALADAAAHLRVQRGHLVELVVRAATGRLDRGAVVDVVQVLRGAERVVAGGQHVHRVAEGGGGTGEASRVGAAVADRGDALVVDDVLSSAGREALRVLLKLARDRLVDCHVHALAGRDVEAVAGLRHQRHLAGGRDVQRGEEVLLGVGVTVRHLAGERADRLARARQATDVRREPARHAVDRACRGRACRACRMEVQPHLLDRLDLVAAVADLDPAVAEAGGVQPEAQRAVRVLPARGEEVDADVLAHHVAVEVAVDHLQDRLAHLQQAAPAVERVLQAHLRQQHLERAGAVVRAAAERDARRERERAGDEVVGVAVGDRAPRALQQAVDLADESLLLGGVRLLKELRLEAFQRLEQLCGGVGGGLCLRAGAGVVDEPVVVGADQIDHGAEVALHDVVRRARVDLPGDGVGALQRRVHRAELLVADERLRVVPAGPRPLELHQLLLLRPGRALAGLPETRRHERVRHSRLLLLLLAERLPLGRGVLLPAVHLREAVRPGECPVVAGERLAERAALRAGPLVPARRESGTDTHTGTRRHALQVAHEHLVGLRRPAVADGLQHALRELLQALAEAVDERRLREVRPVLEVARRLVETLVHLLRRQRAAAAGLRDQVLHAGARPHRRLARREHREARARLADDLPRLVQVEHAPAHLVAAHRALGKAVPREHGLVRLRGCTGRVEREVVAGLERLRDAARAAELQRVDADGADRRHPLAGVVRRVELAGAVVEGGTALRGELTHATEGAGTHPREEHAAADRARELEEAVAESRRQAEAREPPGAVFHLVVVGAVVADGAGRQVGETLHRVGERADHADRRAAPLPETRAERARRAELVARHPGLHGGGCRLLDELVLVGESREAADEGTDARTDPAADRAHGRATCRAGAERRPALGDVVPLVLLRVDLGAVLVLALPGLDALRRLRRLLLHRALHGAGVVLQLRVRRLLLVRAEAQLGEHIPRLLRGVVLLVLQDVAAPLTVLVDVADLDRAAGVVLLTAPGGDTGEVAALVPGVERAGLLVAGLLLEHLLVERRVPPVLRAAELTTRVPGGAALTAVLAVEDVAPAALRVGRGCGGGGTGGLLLLEPGGGGGA